MMTLEQKLNDVTFRGQVSHRLLDMVEHFIGHSIPSGLVDHEEWAELENWLYEENQLSDLDVFNLESLILRYQEYQVNK